MKAKDLATLLLEHPEREVIMQKDAEGNGFSPLEGCDEFAIYVPDSKYSGKVYDTCWSATENRMDEDKFTKLHNLEKCFVLYPVN